MFSTPKYERRLPFTEAGVNITSSSPLGDTMRSLLFEAKYTSLSIQLRYLRSPFPVSKVSGRREKALGRL